MKTVRWIEPATSGSKAFASWRRQSSPGVYIELRRFSSAGVCSKKSVLYQRGSSFRDPPNHLRCRMAPSDPTFQEGDAVLREYADLAARYERRWSFYVRATSRETMARFEMEPTGSLLDVGCGTGALLQALSENYPQTRLAGMDPCPEMLDVARHRLHDSVELKEGWAERIPYSDRTFDCVVSCNAFHYIRRPLAALAEMQRVLRPGGTLVITDWCDDYLACRICDWYLRIFNAAHYRTYRAKECKGLLEEIGVMEVTVKKYKISWLWGMMTATARKNVA